MNKGDRRANIVNVVGARPNFIKMAPIVEELRKHEKIEFILVHTGQHYDYEMSATFFADLSLSDPDIHLGVGSGSHAEQTGQIMMRFEKVLVEHRPDLVIVVGDVNSTLACALAATKLHIPVAHVEAGLRSFDRMMPEETNRLITDAISDYLFVTEKSGKENLLKEGIAPNKIFLVGNVMIDTLVRMLPRALKRSILNGLNLEGSEYVLVTLHRPSNVDRFETLREILSALESISHRYPVIFPMHPRTRENLDKFEIQARGITILEPLGYLDFLALMNSAGLVMTDSGGIQEETTYLGVPCLTLRSSTERPLTTELGTNRLVDSQRQAILDAIGGIKLGERVTGRHPDLWDGRTADRIAQVMCDQGE